MTQAIFHVLPSPAMESPSPGRTVIGRYQVLRQLGESPMAETWLCRMHGHLGFTREVVVKVLRPAHMGDSELEGQFANEARIGVRLDHAHIRRVEELGLYAGAPYIVFEYIDGPDVQRILEAQRARGHNDVRLGCQIVADVARALHHAHTVADARAESGSSAEPLRLVHCDVSPTNVVVSAKGLTKLIDFGVARRGGQATSGSLAGRLRYLAPEVVQGAPATHAADLFALGAVLYALCVGEHAWSPDDLERRTHGTFALPRERRPDLPPELERIILRAMAPQPASRYRHGECLAEDLERFLASYGGPVSESEIARKLASLFPRQEWRHARPQGQGGRRGTPWRGLTILGSAALLCLLGWGGFASFQLTTSPVAARLVASQQLDDVQLALDERRDADAAAGLRALAHTDELGEGWMARRDDLHARLYIRGRVRGARRLLTHRPEEALARAVLLDEEFPGERDVSALLRDAHQAVAVVRGDHLMASRAAASAPDAVGPLGILRLAKLPSGAEVWVDGWPVFEPHLPLEVAPGTHWVSIRGPDRPAENRRLQVRGGQTVEVRLDASP